VADVCHETGKGAAARWDVHAETRTVDAEGRLLARGSEQRCSSEVAWIGADGKRAAASRGAAARVLDRAVAASARLRAEGRRQACGGELRGDGKRASAS
jgi:hypothetical protein